MADNEDFYYNTEGYVVFNEEYHLKRGYCCGNGCKHCPYDFKMVPEPRRTKLLAARAKRQAGGNDAAAK